MIKRLFFFLISFAIIHTAIGQAEPADTASPVSSGLRISLLTCGTGNEIYEIFGHTAVRVVDSSKTGPARDLVYNYGMFNGFDENFELKFMQGKLLYFVATNYFGDFMEEYAEQGRKVEEQVLVIDDDHKKQISAFLYRNTLPQNMYYKYDFFFDNCATRIRDIFPQNLGKTFVYANVVPPSHPTFRDIMNQYFYRNHWERVGVNILLGSRIDKVMTNDEIMFLPDFLRDGLAGATANGAKVTTPTEVLLPGNDYTGVGTNVPLYGSIAILLLTAAGLFVKKLRLLGRIMSFILLFVSGLLGVLILVMWLGTNHQGCGDNFNVLWALPVNLMMAFSKPAGKTRYSIIAMLLIIISLLMHLVHIQGLIVELMPVLLALLLVHTDIFRKSKNVAINDKPKQ